MAEVLSQSQIDALLSAARSGEMDLNRSDQSGEKKYRKYDFYSPRKFTKDRLKMISGIFENYTRIINSRLNGLLHTTSEIAVESVEEQRYYEFSNALSDGDVLTLADVVVDGKQESEETPVLFHLSTGLALNMMDRLMGGEGENGAGVPAGYSFTALELKLYEDIVKDLIGILGGSWENYIDLQFSYRRVEATPTLVQLIGLDETVVIIGISIKFPNASGRMSICLPGMMLTNIFAQIAALNQVGRGAGENHSEEIMDILRDSRLEITAELGRTQLTLQDIYYLNVGDVVDLGHPTQVPVNLYIGGQPWFNGKLGTQGGNMAVKILDTYHVQTREEK
ncbi:flagellar motor switch protein FliM [Flavonifractor plautii]|uniref:flagellar motor switch protein FliM n=1 Tax=Flavonifractor plautii TaxID=292800 RepID=UPI00195BC892|nr:FliM/FliN family flagellar motor switch protein [Flavonifractor plautii]MBM6665036.1 flagellar motor switch protein FliM [Flavonifractor plautii]